VLRTKGCLLLLCTISLLGCGQQYGARLAFAPEPACGFFQSLAGYRISWAARTPVRLYVSKNWPVELKPVILKAATIWNSTNQNTYMTVSFDSGAVGISPAPDNLNGLYWMTSWSASRPSEQGVTTLRYKGERATEADVRINAKNFKFYDESPDQPSDIHLSSLLVHEFGHFLGLTHAYVSSSVMYPFLPASTKREQLYSSELEALACEYGGGAL